MRPLLDNNVSKKKYYLSWMWPHTSETKEPYLLQGRDRMSKAANKSKICYLPKSNVDFILEYERENTYWFESLGVE
jgi:hypothetical protein